MRVFLYWRNFIHAATPKRIATQDAFDCEPATFPDTMRLESFLRIGRAGRMKPTMPADIRGKHDLVKSNDVYDKAYHE